MLDKFLEAIKTRLFTVKIKERDVRWIVDKFSKNFSRQFDANTILFINDGLVNVSINDIFSLTPGASLSLEANQNEIDKTYYQITFTAGAGPSLSVWSKRDRQQPDDEQLIKEEEKNSATSRREQDMQSQDKENNKQHNRRGLSF